MPDPGVNQRLAALETALAARHTETTNQLTSILQALGAPPPGPTTTLADVVTAIQAGNALLTDIKQLLTDIHLDTMSMDLKLLTIRNQQTDDSARIESIRLNTQATNTNVLQVAANTELIGTEAYTSRLRLTELKSALGMPIGDATTTVLGYLGSLQYAVPRIYDAIWATSCCENLPTSLPPALGVNPITVNATHCQRVQYFIDEIAAESYRRIGEAAAAAGALSVAVVAALLALPSGGSSLAIVAGTSLIASGSSIGAYMISTEFDSALRIQLRQALYAAETPAEAKAAWDATIAANDAPAAIRAIWNWYPFNGNFNDLYDPAVIWDVGAYDGNVCAPAGPEIIEGTAVLIEGYYRLQFPSIPAGWAYSVPNWYLAPIDSYAPYTYFKAVSGTPILSGRLLSNNAISNTNIPTTWIEAPRLKEFSVYHSNPFVARYIFSFTALNPSELP